MKKNNMHGEPKKKINAGVKFVLYCFIMALGIVCMLTGGILLLTKDILMTIIGTVISILGLLLLSYAVSMNPLTEVTTDFSEIIESKLTEKSKDIFEQIQLNTYMVRDYYQINIAQAKSIFFWCKTLSILGFILFAVGVVYVIINGTFDGILIITTLSGAIIEVLAGSMLFMYNKTLKQLNLYYSSLLDNERYLSIVSLVDRIAEDKRDEAYIKIIESELKSLHSITLGTIQANASPDFLRKTKERD